MYQGVNLPRLGGYNLSVVLDCIRRSPDGLSRVEISDLTRLSPQTISNVTRRLLDEGLVQETGTRNIGMGKPRTILTTTPLAMLAVGIHIDPVMVQGVVVDLTCQPRAESSIATPHDFSPTDAVAQVEGVVRELLADPLLARSRMVGVGVAVPGPLQDGVIIDPPTMPSWRDIDLGTPLSERLECPVFVEKDVICSATGEKWLRRTSGDFGYLYLGTGVGFGLVAGGEVQLGTTGNIGEIGHLRVASSGAPCPCCGTPGTLGQLTLPESLVREARALGVSTEPEPRNQGDVGEQFRRLCARADEPAVTPLFERMGEHLGAAAATLSDLLDLREMVLGGPYGPLLPEVILPRLGQVANSRAVLRTVRQVTVSPAASPQASESVGAASLVFDRLLSANTRQLVEPGARPGVLLR
ncbi:MAG: ROK family transcriptional regulator [Propionibacteriaceae bacterium]|nr:ROK family transcriptional regulator [Propionibacteriaceae bacterium]